VSGIVLWDFDGTLAERPGMWRGCLLEVLHEEEPAVEVDADVFIPALRDRFPWHRPDEAHLELCEADAWWSRIVPLLAEAYEGAGVEPARAVALAELARARYIDPAIGWRLFDDAVPALSLLGEAGWRHAVLSNHVPELERIVSGLGLDRFVETVLCSAVTGYEKPHPEAFAAAGRLRRNGEPVWMVGDNPEADFEGARRAGLQAVLVRRTGVGLLEAAKEILAS
jgi:HAD superfamily hydrolase (TIGR01549 family)